MTIAEAKIIADSITEDGHRLTSIQVKHWRPVLAEVNTHKVLSKNSASSRAIPFEKQLEKFLDDPANPIVWASEQKGMQGGAELTGSDLEDAQDLWANLKTSIAEGLLTYIDKHPDKSTRLHKSILNRVLEFGQWHTALLTGTAWENFLWQRDHEDAQPEFRVMAHEVRLALEKSEPIPLVEGEWHTPYILTADIEELQARAKEHSLTGERAEQWVTVQKCRISAARCARTSYETQAGLRDHKEDIGLFGRLINDREADERPLHWSPLEHVATPDPSNRQSGSYEFVGLDGKAHIGGLSHLPKIGNLLGWRSLRVEEEAIMGVTTYR